jgi:hypothetical protein
MWTSRKSSRDLGSTVLLCYEADAEVSLATGLRPICICESEREAELWGGQRVKVSKTQGWWKVRRKAPMDVEHMEIQIKTVD